MNTVELAERLARWEDLHTEFKEAFESDRELAKDIVCFANTDGGQLVFGITDDRAVVGVQDVDWLLAKIEDIAYQHCQPPVTVVQEVLEFEGKRLVVVNIPKGSQRPYQTKSGLCYVRTANRCRLASREELLRLFQAAGSLFYDETPLVRFGLPAIDLDAVRVYLKRTGQTELGDDLERLLRNWRLYDGEHPTVSGVILFGKDVPAALPFAGISAARFPGTDTADDPIDRKDLSGQLLDVVDRAARFLAFHLSSRHEIRGFEPETRPEVPQEALREAVVNAVAHRDYTVPGPVRLFILRDRIEVHSPGKPPNTVDAEAMRAGVHVVRNPHIYARLSDAGLVTGAGTGVRRMIKLVRQAMGLDVGISITDSEVILTIPRPA